MGNFAALARELKKIRREIEDLTDRCDELKDSIEAAEEAAHPPKPKGKADDDD